MPSHQSAHGVPLSHNLNLLVLVVAYLAYLAPVRADHERPWGHAPCLSQLASPLPSPQVGWFSPLPSALIGSYREEFEIWTADAKQAEGSERPILHALARG